MNKEWIKVPEINALFPVGFQWKSFIVSIVKSGIERIEHIAHG